MPEKRYARALALGAAAGLVLGFVLGLSGGWLLGGAAPSPPPLPVPSEPGEISFPAPPPPQKDPRAEERRWLHSRPAGEPALAYLFSADRGSLGPLGGSLLERAEEEDLALGLTGPAHLAAGGAVFLDGGRLLSARAGRELALEIRRRGRFSVEAVVRPADARHGGPARIVSLSFDSAVRNFTLGQEGERWVVRLRTSRTGENGTNPEVHVPGLSPRRAHVVVTYDGKTERVYLDGKEARSAEEVAGDLNGWDPGFPLVVGNEAYDARNWEGLVRFVAFYARVLSPEEVEAAARALPSGDPPLGHGPSPPPSRPPRPGVAPAEAPPVGAGDDVF